MPKDPVKICVVMPAFNEEKTIAGFIKEVLDRGQQMGFDIQVKVVDDCSTDNTIEVLRELAQEHSQVQFVNNTTNMGHGPSTLRALELGLSSHADTIVSTDGDGNVEVSDLMAMAEESSRHHVLVEGCRTLRDDSWFRRVTSFATRALVWARTSEWPKDANSPHRAYCRETLSFLLDWASKDFITPNLMFTAKVRAHGIPFRTYEVREVTRQGANAFGVSWNQSISYLPSKRFLNFCREAASQWLGFSAFFPESNRLGNITHRLLVGRNSAGRYALIGFSGVFLDFLIFTVLSLNGTTPLIASAVGTLAGILNNYFWNSKLNFHIRVSSSRGIKFLTVGVAGLLLSSGMLLGMLTLGITPMIAKMMTLPVVVIAQFLSNKFWTFRGVAN